MSKRHTGVTSEKRALGAMWRKCQSTDVRPSVCLDICSTLFPVTSVNTLPPQTLQQPSREPPRKLSLTGLRQTGFRGISVFYRKKTSFSRVFKIARHNAEGTFPAPLK